MYIIVNFEILGRKSKKIILGGKFDGNRGFGLEGVRFGTLGIFDRKFFKGT